MTKINKNIRRFSELNTINTPNDFFELFKKNNFKTLNIERYTLSELKSICRYYYIKVSGNKSDLQIRVYSHIKSIYFVIKIQKIFRQYILKIYNKCHGPSAIKRHLCINESDFITLDTLKEIPYNNFYSFKDKDNYIYGFDVISLYNLFESSKKQCLNPYTRNVFPDYVMRDILKLLKFSKLLKIDIDLIIKEDDVSLETIFKLRVVKIFQKMDELGNNTDIKWFMDLNNELLIKYIRYLVDIWNYRADLSFSIKREICPPNGNPFNDLNLNIDLVSSDINKMKNIVLLIMEKLINLGIKRDSRVLGATYVLSALTLVSESAAQALPWLYYSVSLLD